MKGAMGVFNKRMSLANRRGKRKGGNTQAATKSAGGGKFEVEPRTKYLEKEGQKNASTLKGRSQPTKYRTLKDRGGGFITASRVLEKTERIEKDRNVETGSFTSS